MSAFCLFGLSWVILVFPMCIMYIVQLCDVSAQSDNIWAKSVILCHYSLLAIMLVGIRAEQPLSFE